VINDGGPPVLSSDGQVDDGVRRNEGRMMVSLICSTACWYGNKVWLESSLLR
jgi:hypothetical protein